MKLIDDYTLIQIVARELYPGFRCKRDGMSKPEAAVLAYRVGNREYRPTYRHVVFEMSDHAKYSVWFADIDEERLVFYKNLRQISEVQE